MSKVLCIYHAKCDDGFGAAYAVWKRLGESAEFFAGTYGEPPPDVTGREVLMVDFSYKRPVLEAMIEAAETVVILDHHKTAQEDLAGLNNVRPGVKVIFDMARSGAGLAWDYFHPYTRRPSLIDYIEDRDLWTKKMPGVDEFTAALRSYPQDFEVWDGLMVGELIDEGGAILRYYRALVEQAKSHAYRREIGGHVVPVVNASMFMASELAGELAAGEPFAAVYAESETHVLYSLRSRAPDGLDVSEIAKKFGGGGHKHAAGFRVARSAGNSPQP